MCQFWTEKSETVDHMLNALIECREYVKDALVRPSNVAHLIFQYVDDLFMTNREVEIDKRGLVDEFVDFLMGKVREKIAGCDIPYSRH